jgi:hypothetical protein
MHLLKALEGTLNLSEALLLITHVSKDTQRKLVTMYDHGSLQVSLASELPTVQSSVFQFFVLTAGLHRISFHHLTLHVLGIMRLFNDVSFCCSIG